VTDRQLRAAKRLLSHLADILQADLSVRLWNGDLVPLGPRASSTPAIDIRSPRALTRLARSPRLSTVFKLLVAGDVDIEGGTLLDVAARRGSIKTRELLRRLDKRLALSALWPFVFGAAATPGDDSLLKRLAAIRDDKALVQFHYDLSNAFYALFLDAEMQYSCGYYPSGTESLATAQHAKLDLICRKLRLAPGERFLDIGCGWGGLVCHAARHYGVMAHGVTLSEAQLAFARDKIARLGLGGRVTVELRDYRALDGAFDKIAAIEMFEHVGLDNHAAFFAKMNALLRPRGLLLNQATARRAKPDLKRFRRKRPEYDAITRYVFPGAEVDHIGLSLTNLECQGFEVHEVDSWRDHYVRTCRLWCERLAANRAAAEREVGATTTRLWLLYLAGCALGFERNALGVFQTLASKRGKGLSGLAPATIAGLPWVAESALLG
jgi:cyclopropane-fatty-acyl-phospholipid synthase